MPNLLTLTVLLGLLTSTAYAAVPHSRCPLSITYTTPSNCAHLKCPKPTCTSTSLTTILPAESYCGTKTRKLCLRSCPSCFVETATVDGQGVPLSVQPGGPIIVASPTTTALATGAQQCKPYTITSTAPNPACTFKTSHCIRPLCVIETTTTVPACGEVVTKTQVAQCATACPAGCATFVYTATAGAGATSTAYAEVIAEAAGV